MGVLWYNGTIRTMEHEEAQVEAVFTENGWIIAAGSRAEIESRYGDRISQRQDLHGGTMFPGFTDSHGHMMMYGQSLIRLDLSESNSWEEIMEMLTEKEASLEKDEWLFAEGWNENRFPDKYTIDKNELDERFPNRPVMLTRICRHAMIVNSKALEIAGITDDSPNPSGGVIVKDNEEKTTGLLVESAQDFIYDVAPFPSELALQKGLTRAYESMLEQGLTGIHTEDLNHYDDFRQVIRAYDQVIDGDRRKFRVHHLVNHEVLDDFQKTVEDLREDDYQTFGAVKIFADGSLGGRSAWMTEPYLDQPDTAGVPIHTPEKLANWVKKAREYNRTVAVHVIGDAALLHTIEAIEAHPPQEDQKDRLIHVQVANPELIERLQKLPVVLDIQPRFTISDFPWVENLINPDRLAYSYAWKTLLQKGIPCAGGADTPVEPSDPLLGLHAAITRRKPGEKHDGYLPEQKLTPYEAAHLFTVGSAEASGHENTFGKIASGYRADFTVLDKDPLKMSDPDELLQTSVLYTIVDDTVVYRKG